MPNWQKSASGWWSEPRLASERQKMSKTTMHILWLLVLMLLAFAGASAQRVQPAPRDQKPKPAASTESAASKFFDAVKAGDVDPVRRLLEQNPALISVRTEFGWTPLHVAVDAEQEKIVEL